MEKGTQLGDHGESSASATHSGISVNFAATGLNIGNNPNEQVQLILSSGNGSGQTTQTFVLSTDATGHQTWTSQTNNAITITDDPVSTLTAQNSQNLGFTFLGGTPNLPAGDYTETIQVVGLTGLQTGHVLAYDTAIIHAS